MTLNEMQKEFKKEASKLGDYQGMSKTELANGYCDEEEAMWAAEAAGDTKAAAAHDQRRSAYYAALYLRYWYKIFRWMQDSASLNLEPIDFIEWLQWTFWDAFYYRLWRWEYKAEVKDGHFIQWKLDENGEKIPNPYYWKVDETAPDKVINRCSASARGYFYQYYNKDKRRASVQAYSIDSMIDESGDCALDYSGCIVEAPSVGGVSDIIKALLKKNEGIEALIVDGIVNHPTFKETKIKKMTAGIDEEGETCEEEAISIGSVFDPRKLVKHLNAVNQEFLIAFCKDYDKSDEYALAIYDKLKKMNNTKLYKSIQKTLIELRNNQAYLNCLYS